jgi:hypothetical protein
MTADDEAPVSSTIHGGQLLQARYTAFTASGVKSQADGFVLAVFSGLLKVSPVANATERSGLHCH